MPKKKNTKKDFFSFLFSRKMFFLKTTMAVMVLVLVSATLVSALTPPSEIPILNYNVKIGGGRAGLVVTSTEVALAVESLSDNASSSYGVYASAKSASGTGMGNATAVKGVAQKGTVEGTASGLAIGVHGLAQADEGNLEAIGVLGNYNGGSHDERPLKAYGVKGVVSSGSPNDASNVYGVYGIYYGFSGIGSGYGVYGAAPTGGSNSAAIYGQGDGNDNWSSYAGYFDGKVYISGDLIFSTSHATTTPCSTLGGVYFNKNIKELCFCDGSTWRKVSATTSVCN